MTSHTTRARHSHIADASSDPSRPRQGPSAPFPNGRERRRGRTEQTRRARRSVASSSCDNSSRVSDGGRISSKVSQIPPRRSRGTRNASSPSAAMGYRRVPTWCDSRGRSSSSRPRSGRSAAPPQPPRGTSHATQPRRVSQRHAELAVFAFTHRAKLTWPYAYEVWKRTHPEEKPIEVSNFARDCRAAFETVTGSALDWAGERMSATNH